MDIGWPQAFSDVGRALGYYSGQAYDNACLLRPDEVQARIGALRYEDQP